MKRPLLRKQRLKRMEKRSNGSLFNNIITVPTSYDTNFFKYWVDFLTPIHHLTKREREVFTMFLKKRWEYSQKISDPQMLEEYSLSNDIKREVREACDLKPAHFHVIMTNLKKAKIIVNNRINPLFIPNIKENKASFNLLLYFPLSTR